MGHLKHRTSSWIGAALVAVLGLSLWGCQEETTSEEQTQSELQPITIVPEFRLEGLGTLGEGFVLDEVSLGVGEIRLEPLGDPLGNGADEAIYVTRSAFALRFDVSSGEAKVVGEPILLPHGGDFMISIRIEPAEALVRDAEEDESASVRIDGMMARYINPNLTDLHATGDPTPLPMKGGAAQDPESLVPPVRWVPWTWSTQEVGLVVLNDVHFSDDPEQKLLLRVDLDNWLQEAVAPITAAVEAASTASTPSNEGRPDRRREPVNVNERVERSLGSGFDQLTQEFAAEVTDL